MIIELKRYLPKEYLNAVNNTYNSISKNYDQASNGVKSEEKEAKSKDKAFWKRYLPKEFLNAINYTYNSISKNNDQASNGVKSEGKEAKSKDKDSGRMPLGEGCYLHILKRTDYQASISSGGVDDHMQDIKSKLDEVIKILNTKKME